MTTTFVGLIGGLLGIITGGLLGHALRHREWLREQRIIAYVAVLKTFRVAMAESAKAVSIATQKGNRSSDVAPYVKSASDAADAFGEAHDRLLLVGTHAARVAANSLVNVIATLQQLPPVVGDLVALDPRPSWTDNPTTINAEAHLHTGRFIAAASDDLGNGRKRAFKRLHAKA